MEFAGQVALVTGAGRGIGGSTAEALAMRGALVVVADIVLDRARQVYQELGDSGRQAQAFCLDVRDSRAVDDLFATVARDHSRLDIVVANAGIVTMAPVAEMEEKTWDDCLAVNAKGVFLTCRAALRYMIPARSGRIVTVSSIAGKTGFPYTAHYSAAKFAVIGFSQALAREVTPLGINVNAVCPGFVDTPMLDELQAVTDPQRYPDTVVDSRMGRKAHPDEVAELICFLCSTRAAYISGQAYNICGLAELH